MVGTNVAFAASLFEAMAEAGVSRVVNTATFWQHFDGRSYSPTTLYAATKQAAEDILQYYVELLGWSAITLVLADVYGPHDERAKLYGRLVNWQRGDPPLDVTEGHQFLDLVHVDDVTSGYAEAISRVLEAGPGTSERFSLKSPRPLTVQQLVAQVEKIRSIDLPIRWGAVPYRKREMLTPWALPDVLPSWSPNIALADGLLSCMTAAARP